jgi:hypothetical protein
MFFLVGASMMSVRTDFIDFIDMLDMLDMPYTPNRSVCVCVCVCVCERERALWRTEMANSESCGALLKKAVNCFVEGEVGLRLNFKQHRPKP